MKIVNQNSAQIGIDFTQETQVLLSTLRTPGTVKTVGNCPLAAGNTVCGSWG